MINISSEDLNFTDEDIRENEARTKMLEMMMRLYNRLEDRGSDYTMSIMNHTLIYQVNGTLEITGAIDVLKVTENRYSAATIGPKFRKLDDFPRTFYQYIMEVFLD